jgi:RNA polymerase sigma-70 factor (ECF subfamily)
MRQTMNKGLDKENLLVAEAQKDPSRFAELYDKYVEQIYRYVYRRVSDQQTAEDLVSQTFYDALSHLKSYEPRGYPFSAWLYKIAHNNVLKWYRTHSRIQKVDLDEIAELKDTTDLVEDETLRQEKEGIREVLDRLDFEDRELIRLKYFEEVSNIEIGQIMGITANNVGVKLYRALKKLKQLIA